MTNTETKFFNLIVARCLPRVRNGETFCHEMVEQEIRNELAFEEEMVAGKTERAQKARRVMAAVLWSELRG